MGEVIFEGSPGLHRDALAGAMKDNKKHDVLTWVAGKDTFKQNKLSTDLTAIKTKLQESGFMEATVLEPRISDTARRNIFFQKTTMKSIVIPVQAGERYRVGDVTVEGNKLRRPRT